LVLSDRDRKDVPVDLRAFSKAPIMILSACDREAEMILALALGPDDFIENAS